MYYVVMKVGWEYNDETYSASSDNAGHIHKIFTDRTKADTLALELNLKTLKETGLGGYFYGIEDIIDCPYDSRTCNYDKSKVGRLEDILEEMGTSLDEESYQLNLKNATEEQLKDILDLVTIRWYEVVEVKE